MTLAFRNKCFAAAKNSIGHNLRVRTGKTSSFKGEIINAEFVGTRKRKRSLIARFKVTLRHPVAGTEREFEVESLPR